MQSQFKSMDFQYTFKIIIVGDAGVGKTSLMYKYIYGTEQHHSDITIGVEFGSNTIELKGEVVKVHIWDTSGQERFRSITRSYYRSAAGCVVVYDITNYKSFQNVKNWLNDVRSLTPNIDIPIILVGTKNDLVAKRTVSYSEGAELAAEEGLLFMETSVYEEAHPLFNVLCEKIYEYRHQLPNGVRETNIRPPSAAPPTAGDTIGCCFLPFF